MNVKIKIKKQACLKNRKQAKDFLDKRIQKQDCFYTKDSTKREVNFNSPQNIQNIQNQENKFQAFVGKFIDKIVLNLRNFANKILVFLQKKAEKEFLKFKKYCLIKYEIYKQKLLNNKHYTSIRSKVLKIKDFNLKNSLQKNKNIKLSVKKKTVKVSISFSLSWQEIKDNCIKFYKNVHFLIKNKFKYVSVLIVFVAILVSGLFLYKFYPIMAATYYWTQASWLGGADTANFPVHPTNQAEWTKYYEKEAGISAGATLQLQALPGEWNQQSNTDFAEGTLENTSVRGTGNDAVITLD